MIEEIRRLLSRYILLNKTLEFFGGRSTINNAEQEKTYSMLLESEDEILKKFGLPPLMKYRQIMFNFIETDQSEIEILKTIENLSTAAEAFLSSSPTSEIDLLRNAKINDLKTYDVLPEIEIDDHIYSMFLFEEVFKKDRCSEIQFTSILKKIDIDTLRDLGQIHYEKFHKLSNDETEIIIQKLRHQGIEYLDEFINYTPVYPY